MDQPAWFKQLAWQGGVHVAALNENRAQVPEFTGCYVFTVGKVPVAPGRVLYVGEAARQSLRRRVASYLTDFRSRPGPRGRQHKGKAFILEARQRSGDHGIYVQWVEYGASPADIHTLEASLINYLNPAANDRVEEERHPVLAEWERLNPRLIR
ncbi:hypothetical protein [Variovorax sp. KK3]|uniref:hypothetical protein n=1 Tax=Variovorax sp. KK3 TaxID=1855728 RepID=UPI00097BE2D1|nr:hypothetical protein [Variovorax sp. KK3]